MKQTNKMMLTILITIVLIMLAYLGFKDDNGNFDFQKLFNDVLAIIIVFGFFVLVAVLLRRFSGQNQQNPQSQMQLQTEEIDKDFSINMTKSDVTFKDVAGIDEVKEELEEVVDFLKNPSKYEKFGIKLPKGVLLVGPPGVGKTLIAKAVAGEAGVPFFYQSGAGFVQMYVGIGAKRVKDLFNKAKTSSPAIIFIDEIDAIGKARGALRNDEREATLNQLLTEMDGFEKSEGVVVIAATNKIELLDDALLRAGRFDRRVYVDLPGLKEREEILKVYLKNKPYSDEITELAKMSVGFNGASLASFVNEASIHALKRDATNIENQDFIAIKDKVLIGKKKILTYTEQEKRVLSYYQAAKAVIAYWLDIDFDKITLVKDDFKDIDRELVSKSEIMSKISVYLSGIVCVEDIFNERYSNAKEDVFKAKELANEMVSEYAMGENLLGNEMEVASIIDEQFNKTKVLYVSQKEVILKAQEILFESEILYQEDLKRVMDEVL